MSGSIIKGGEFDGLRRRHYRVIYADPPWQFKTWSHRGKGKSAEQHYSTMSIDDVCRLPVRSVAADDAVLFLWVIASMLPQAMRVVRRWGFTFKTVGFCWVKMPRYWDQSSFVRPRIGLGYHTRAGMEQCWLATRGDGYARADKGVHQVLHSSTREHSRKPDEIVERIERLCGDAGPRLELFSRQRRPGWDAWGKEVDRFIGGDND